MGNDELTSYKNVRIIEQALSPSLSLSLYLSHRCQVSINLSTSKLIHLIFFYLFLFTCFTIKLFLFTFEWWTNGMRSTLWNRQRPEQTCELSGENLKRTRLTTRHTTPAAHIIMSIEIQWTEVAAALIRLRFNVCFSFEILQQLICYVCVSYGRNEWCSFFFPAQLKIINSFIHFDGERIIWRSLEKWENTKK